MSAIVRGNCRVVGIGCWRRVAVAAAAVVVLGVTAGRAGAAGSIFDDDWKPPARAAEKPAAGRPADPVPAKPADAPPVQPPSGVKPAEAAAPDLPLAPPPLARRLAIPPKADLDQSRKLFREMFAAELADKAPKARRELAVKLLDGGHKCADKPSDQYALYAGARQAALDARDLRLCYAAADALAGAFDVDPLAVKGEAAALVGVQGETPAATATNLDETMALLDALVASEDYVTAGRLGAAVQKAAADDPFFHHLLPRRAKDIEAMRAALDRVRKDREKLAATPGDSAAAGSVGAYLCFLRGDWAAGLPLLAKGANPELRKVAAADLAGAADPDAARKLADAWAAAAVRQPDAARGQIVEHAVALYRRALAGATGMQKLATETAMQKAARAAGPRRVELLSIVDPAADAVGGQWSVKDGALHIGGEACRLELPYTPGDEYVYRVRFTARGEVNVVMGMWKA